MQSQFRRMGYSYDWSREIDYLRPVNTIIGISGSSSSSSKPGWRIRRKSAVNWCPECQTALANEQVVNGTCERCSTGVMKRMMEQWYFRITQYAERLLDGHAKLDWPEDVILMQKNWIGKSQGVEFAWQLDGREDEFPRLHHPPGHRLRRDLHGAGAGASAGG